MSWLIVILHLFVGSTLAGVGIIIVLVTGHASLLTIGGAVLGGYLLAVPLSVVVARAMKDA